MTLQIRGLTTAYGRRVVLEDVTATFGTGVHFIMGENGAGKSTLLRSILGLQQHDGQVSWDGAPLVPEARLAAAVFDTAPAYTGLTGHQNISVLSPESRKGPARYLDDVKLSRRVSSYSHGERMRLALMIALNCPSPILLLDEPTNGLDRSAMTQLREDLVALKGSRTMILTGHNLEFFDTVADSVTLLRGGRLERIEDFGTTTKEVSIVQLHDTCLAPGAR